MKIRTGFVSNSSSSSFIGIIGKVVDTEKFKEFKKRHEFDIKIKSVEQVNEEIKHCGDFYDSLSKLDETKYKDSYLIFESDNIDMGYDENYEMIEADSDDFPEMFSWIGGDDSGIEVIQDAMYTGRDG